MPALDRKAVECEIRMMFTEELCFLTTRVFCLLCQPRKDDDNNDLCGHMMSDVRVSRPLYPLRRSSLSVCRLCFVGPRSSRSSPQLCTLKQIGVQCQSYVRYVVYKLDMSPEMRWGPIPTPTCLPAVPAMRVFRAAMLRL